MAPVAILAYAIYLGLKLSQGYLSHEKYKILAEERIALLEEEVQEWRAKQSALRTIRDSKVGEDARNEEAEPQAGGQSKRWWSFSLL
ncbi:hypothetical protein FRB96_000585 [Tulasnella sp. 330]|nr:hypothetical protein FRB96_000585 [Tulasnella sp. 330]